MTIKELREGKEYEICFKKIRSYRKGFVFTLNYSQIPRGKANALKIVMQDAIDAGLIESIALGYSLEGKEVSETYRKIGEAENE